MNLSILDPNLAQPHWMEAHKAGCADLKKRTKHGEVRGTGAWGFEAASLTEAAEEIAADFIEEGSMTVEDALASIHFAPCVALPLTDPSTETPEENTMTETTATRSEMIAALKTAGVERPDRMKNVDLVPAYAALQAAQAEAPAERNLRAARIPAGVEDFACAACHETKPLTSFPTATGPQDRTTTCRPCRNAARRA